MAETWKRLAAGCALATAALSGIGLLAPAAMASETQEFAGLSFARHYTPEEIDAAVAKARDNAYASANFAGFTNCTDDGHSEFFNVKSFTWEITAYIRCTR